MRTGGDFYALVGCNNVQDKGPHRATLDGAHKPVLVALATDRPLDTRSTAITT